MHENEVLMKTHLIINSQEDNYDIAWHGKINEVKPSLNYKGLPTFVAVSSNGRMESSTADLMGFIKSVKKFTCPKGRTAYTCDSAQIYIKTEDGKEYHIATVKHNRIKHYAPMYDWVPLD